MNRCFHCAVWRTILTTAFLGLSLVASAQDSVRPFPKNALRGTLQVIAPPDVLMDGRPTRLSPGSRIRGVNNLLVMSGSLVGQELVVNYVRDPQGQLHDVWLLNPTEARQPMANAVPTHNYQSAYDTVDQPEK